MKDLISRRNLLAGATSVGVFNIVPRSVLGGRGHVAANLLVGTDMPAAHTLEKGHVKLTVTDTGVVTITDIRTGISWTTVKPIREGSWPNGGPCVGGPMKGQAPSEAVTITGVSLSGDSITVRAVSYIPLVITWTISAAHEVIMTVDSPELKKPVPQMEKVHGTYFRYPEPLYAKDIDHLAVPQEEGLLYDANMVNMDEDHERFLPKMIERSLSMPWWGQTDLDRGIMTRVDTPYHASYRLTICETPYGEKAVPCLYHSFQPDGTFGYARTVSFSLVDKGGYVAMAKKFRAYAKNKGVLVTMREKARKNPNVNRLLGALDMYIFYNTPGYKTGSFTAEHVKKLHDLGYKNLLLEIFAGTTPEPEIVYTKEALTLGEQYGWLMGAYHLYSWIYVRTPEDMAKGKELAIQEKPEGFVWRPSAWGDYGYYCPAILKDVLEPVAKKKADYGFTAFFTDCTTAGGSVRDCYHPDHPMKKAEAPDRLNDALRAIGDSGLVTGSEKGYWWAVPSTHYFTGMVTLGSYLSRYEFSKKGSHQSGLFRTDLPGYQKYVAEYNLGHRHRVPLFELVFGDCVYATRRWGDHHSRDPELWRANDLLCILYGVAPIVSFSTLDGPHILEDSYKPFHDRYMRTVTDVCGWHEKVGFDEMLSHRFLTDDRSVQETVFAGGNAVVVNFGEKAYRHTVVGTVPAMDFRTFTVSR
jgi:hypothetical protein